MNAPRCFGFFLVFALASTSLACSATADDASGAANQGPTIDAVEGPGEFTEQGNLYVVSLTLRGSDAEGDAITQARVRIAALNIDQKQDVQRGAGAGDDVLLQLGLPTSIPKQTYEVTLNLIDARGNEGPPAAKEIAVP